MVTKFSKVALKREGNHSKVLHVVGLRPDGSSVVLADIEKHPRPSNPKRVKVCLVYSTKSARVKEEVARIVNGQGHGTPWKPSRSAEDAVNYVVRFYGLSDVEVVKISGQAKKGQHQKVA